jgi:FMN-dependent NADH-azoreductase
VHGTLALVNDFLKPFQASEYVILFPLAPFPVPTPMKEYFPSQLFISI